MVTKSVSIGTSPQCVCNPTHCHDIIDILIQNLSANNVYLGDEDVSTTNGIKLVATTGAYSNDRRKSPVYLVADAVSSDVRVTYEIYKEGSRG